MSEAGNWWDKLFSASNNSAAPANAAPVNAGVTPPIESLPKDALLNNIINTATTLRAKTVTDADIDILNKHITALGLKRGGGRHRKTKSCNRKMKRKQSRRNRA